MITPKDSWQIMKLAYHIHRNLPPKDGKYHAVSFNIKLTPKPTEATQERKDI